MSKSRLLSVNFGRGKAGLSTVGYAIYNKDGTAKAANSTTGVSELGTSTGIYFVNIDLDEDFEGIILWTTGEASPRYGLEPTQSQLNSIQNETDNIRLIWNSMRQQGGLLNKIFNGVSKKETKLKIPIYDKDFKSLHAALSKINDKTYPSLKDISETFKSNTAKIPAPVVNIPKTEIPDYTQELLKLHTLLNNVFIEIGKIPKQHKDYTSDLSMITEKLQTALASLEGKLDSASDKINNKISVVAKSDELKGNVGSLHYEINKLKQAVSEAQNKLLQVDTNITNTMKPAKFLQDIYQILEQSADLKKMADEYKKKNDKLRMAGLI